MISNTHFVLSNTLCVRVYTEEEISAMKKELDKYGIQMPSFGKIGGILTNEVSFELPSMT